MNINQIFVETEQSTKIPIVHLWALPTLLYIFALALGQPGENRDNRQKLPIDYTQRGDWPGSVALFKRCQVQDELDKLQKWRQGQEDRLHQLMRELVEVRIC